MFIALPVHAGGLKAELDRSDTLIHMDHPTVLNGTLHNGSASRIYLTGFQVMISNNAAGDMYNPALLHEELRQLDPGQTWDGPLIAVTPKHRGPLDVTGSVILKGGASPDAVDTLATIPLELTIDDPRRKEDGTFERGTVPACDRSPRSLLRPVRTRVCAKGRSMRLRGRRV